MPMGRNDRMRWILLYVMLVLVLCPVTVKAGNNPMTDELEKKGIKNGTVDEENLTGLARESKKNIAAELSSSQDRFDPRDKGMVSAIRSQVGGTCWVYAAMAAVESNLILKGYADHTIDLSELEAVYFLKHPYYDPLGYYTDNTGSLKSEESLTEFMDGGQVGKVIHMLSTWAAPVMESDASFGETQPYDADRLNAIVLEESLTHRNYWHFRNSRSCEYKVTDVKHLIQTYGGVAASYYDGGYYYKSMSEGQDASYYYPYAVTATSHAVEIIGWDDSYAKENFVVAPPGDGAWLCKNSWGQVHDIYNVKSSGYFWLSYYEREIRNIYAVEMDTNQNFQHLYAHDGGSTITGASSGNKVNIAVYQVKADGEEKMERIDGVMTVLAPDTEYRVTVYANPVFQGGMLVGWSGKSGTVTGKSDYYGYYTIDMSAEPVYVADGCSYAICMETDRDGTIGTSAVVKKKGMFYYGNDLMSLKDNADGQQYMPCLRGLTNDAQEVCFSEKVVISETELVFDGYQTKLLTAKVLPEGVTFSEMAYVSSDENVAEVNEVGEITANGVGECEIVVTAYDGKSKAVCKVKVNSGKFSLPDRVMYTGETMQVCPQYENGFQGGSVADYHWSVSNPDLATIDREGKLTALGKGEVTVTAVWNGDSGMSASCCIRIKQRIEELSFKEPVLYMTVGQEKLLGLQVFPADAEEGAVFYEVERLIGTGSISLHSDMICATEEGTFLVRAKATDGSGKSAQIQVVVYGPVWDMSAGESSSELTMYVGEKKTLAFWIFGNNPHSYCEMISVTSSDENMLSVERGAYSVYNGGNTACDICAKSTGDVILVIQSTDTLGKRLVYNIHIKEHLAENREEPLPETITKHHVVYRLGKNSCSVTDAIGNRKSYTIQKSISFRGKKYPVTEIEKNAFRGHSKLRSITIPALVCKVGKNAFYNCKSLKKVTVKSKVLTSVGAKAFKKCNKELRFVFPKSKKGFYRRLFRGKY